MLKLELTLSSLIILLEIILSGLHPLKHLGEESLKIVPKLCRAERQETCCRHDTRPAAADQGSHSFKAPTDSRGVGQALARTNHFTTINIFMGFYLKIDNF